MSKRACAWWGLLIFTGIYPLLIVTSIGCLACLERPVPKFGKGTDKATTKNLLCGMLALLMLLSVGCASSVSGDEAREAAAFLREIADARDRALLTGDVTTYSTYFDSVWPSADPVMNEYDPQVVHGMRERMLAQGTDILDVTSTVPSDANCGSDVLIARRLRPESLGSRRASYSECEP